MEIILTDQHENKLINGIDKDIIINSGNNGITIENRLLTEGITICKSTAYKAIIKLDCISSYFKLRKKYMRTSNSDSCFKRRKDIGITNLSDIPNESCVECFKAALNCKCIIKDNTSNKKINKKRG